MVTISRLVYLYILSYSYIGLALANGPDLDAHDSQVGQMEARYSSLTAACRQAEKSGPALVAVSGALLEDINRAQSEIEKDIQRVNYAMSNSLEIARNRATEVVTQDELLQWRREVEKTVNRGNSPETRTADLDTAEAMENYNRARAQAPQRIEELTQFYSQRMQAKGLDVLRVLMPLSETLNRMENKMRNCYVLASGTGRPNSDGIIYAGDNFDSERARNQSTRPASQQPAQQAAQ